MKLVFLIFSYSLFAKEIIVGINPEHIDLMKNIITKIQPMQKVIMEVRDCGELSKQVLSGKLSVDLMFSCESKYLEFLAHQGVTSWSPRLRPFHESFAITRRGEKYPEVVEFYKNLEKSKILGNIKKI